MGSLNSLELKLLKDSEIKTLSAMKINEELKWAIFSLSSMIPFSQMAELNRDNHIIHGSDRSIPLPPTRWPLQLFNHELPITHAAHFSHSPAPDLNFTAQEGAAELVGLCKYMHTSDSLCHWTI